MPRPKKCRRVCHLPVSTTFTPENGEGQQVVLSVDEFETIRLIDYEGCSQEECAAYMNVARTTVQQIYNNARKKLSTALVEGLPFSIAGGDYHLCDGRETRCGFACGKRCRHLSGFVQKGEWDMVAIPVDDTKEAVCVSFARAPYVVLWNRETGEKKVLENPAAQAESGAGLKAAQFIADCGASALLTPRCGENAAKVLQAAEIKIYQTEGTGLEENLEKFAQGSLKLLDHFHAGFVGIH
jgi:predicted DNA-binding protein (UPF0251 family)/predicted Fe-Mo cluster-binding NifX family protein